MTSTFELGDVYICMFPFTSGSGAKPRPVLVLRDLDIDCLICRITSVAHCGLFDVNVVHWRQAGLEKPSTIRLSRVVTVEKALLKVCIGKLSSDDLNVVPSALNDSPQDVAADPTEPVDGNANCHRIPPRRARIVPVRLFEADHRDGPQCKVNAAGARTASSADAIAGERTPRPSSPLARSMRGFKRPGSDVRPLLPPPKSVDSVPSALTWPSPAVT